MSRRSGILLLVVAAVACSKGMSDPGTDCGPNGECPDGYLCDPSNNKCVRTGGGGADASANVALSLSITGSGTVQVSGGQAPCAAASCAFSFSPGTMVTLTAQPTSGGRFISWSGDCGGEAPVAMVKMDVARSCFASFVERVTVTGAVSGATGTVQASSTDPGASCAAGSCSVDKGGSVTLTAPTIAGFRFSGWSGTGCAGSSPVLQLASLTASASCTATYMQGLAVLGSVVGASGTVKAESTSPGAVCQAGGCTIGPGATVVLTAPSPEGFRFAGWSGDPECTGTSLVLTLANVMHSITCSAGYVQRFTVSGVVAGATGAVKARSTDANASCDGSRCVVDARGRVSLEAPPIDGFRFAGWSGGCSGTDNPVLISNVSADRICTAQYVKRIVVSGNVSGGPTAPVMATSGDAGAACAMNSCSLDPPGSAMLLAPMAPGFRLAGWSGTSACAGNANPLVMTGLTESQACVAAYVPRITVTGAVQGITGEVMATSLDPLADCAAGTACTVDAPGNVSLKAPSPPVGTSFKGWTGAGCESTKQLLELKALTASVTCTAVFTHRITIVVSANVDSAQVKVSSTASSANCGTTECVVDEGTTITLGVTGADTMRFVGWDGEPCAAAGLSRQQDIVLQKEGTCVATFVDARTTTRPAIGTRWYNPTGWLDETLQPIKLTFRPVEGARFECRTGRTILGSAFVEAQPWLPCDGGTGLEPYAIGLPVEGSPNGSYRTEARLAIVAYRSESTSYDYYAHDSLNGAGRCADEITDLEVQNMAAQLALATTQAFGAADVVRNPFIRLTITGGVFNVMALVGSPTLPSPFSFDVLSLRHRFTLLPTATGLPNRYLVVRRQYESLRQRKYRGIGSCMNSYDFGWKNWLKNIAGTPKQARLHCSALLMNAQGVGFCLFKDAVKNVIYSRAYSRTTWEKLLQDNSFSRKNRNGCTREECGLYLPD